MNCKKIIVVLIVIQLFYGLKLSQIWTSREICKHFIYIHKFSSFVVASQEKKNILNRWRPYSTRGRIPVSPYIIADLVIILYSCWSFMDWSLLKGEYLDLVSRKEDVSVTVGSQPCAIQEFASTYIICQVPSSLQQSGNGSGIYEVKV